MSQIPGNTNRNDARFMTTAQRAAEVAGGVPRRARAPLLDSNNGTRDIVDNGEDSNYPRIAAAPNAPLPDSHNPRAI